MPSSFCRYKFKAQEVNRRILEGGPVLPKKPPVKEPTKPVGFDLEIEKRIQERESKKPEEEEEHYEFRSRPCPMKILEDVVVIFAPSFPVEIENPLERLQAERGGYPWSPPSMCFPSSPR